MSVAIMSVDLKDYIMKKNRRHYRMLCISCNGDRGYHRLRSSDCLCRQCAAKSISGHFNKDKSCIQCSVSLGYGNKSGYCTTHRIIHKNQQLKKRIKVDYNYKLCKYLRTRLWKAVNGNYKTGSAVKDLGYSIEEFKAYLESKFQKNMTWDNYGKWHIDHIEPLSSFDLADREQLLRACNYTNLQPLWAKDNLVKSNKIIKGDLK